jgi:RNA polymerase sigma-70 factor (ECF subfamily)
VVAPALSDAEVGELEPALRAYAIRAVGDREVAKDLVQETLLAALRGRTQFAGRAQLRTWAIGILTHKIMDLFRARKHVPLDDRLDDLAEPLHHQPDRVIAGRQALAVLDAGIRELPELERVVVLLIDVEGFGRDEACARLAITPNHLRVVLHRARHRLRRKLESAGVTHG